MKPLRFSNQNFFTLTAFTLGALVIFLPVLTSAQEFVPINQGIPEIKSGDGSISDLMNWVLKITIAAASILAVGMIMIGGYTYMTTEAISGKGEAKKRITDAIIGLLIVLMSVFILSFINPDIVSLKFLEGVSPLKITPSTKPTPTKEELESVNDCLKNGGKSNVVVENGKATITCTRANSSSTTSPTTATPPVNSPTQNTPQQGVGEEEEIAQIQATCEADGAAVGATQAYVGRDAGNSLICVLDEFLLTEDSPSAQQAEINMYKAQCKKYGNGQFEQVDDTFAWCLKI